MSFQWGKGIGYGLLIWLVVFAAVSAFVGFGIYANIWMKAITILLVGIATYIAALKIHAHTVVTALGYGILWVAVGLALDAIVSIGSGSFVFQPQYGFFGGDLNALQIRPRIKVSSRLTLEPGYNMNHATFGRQKFTDHLMTAGINYAFNNQWLTSTLVQYNNVDEKLAVQFRLNYIFHPGDNFYLIYNLGHATAQTRSGQTDQTLAAKLTYSFDF